jgi:prepilin-type processing-associated H-X9-DG protein
VASELILSPDVTWHDVRGRYYNAWHGGVFFSTRVPPNVRQPDNLTWSDPANAVREAPVNNTGTNMFGAARSYHISGGVNICFADGSGRFITNEINPAIMRAIGSRNGKENVNDNF